MSATTARIRSALFGAAIAAALGTGAAAARAEPALADPAARHCWTYTHSSTACRQHCADAGAIAFRWDSGTGCCYCIF